MNCRKGALIVWCVCLHAYVTGCEKPMPAKPVATKPEVDSGIAARTTTWSDNPKPEVKQTVQLQIQFSGRDIAKPGQAFQQGERVALSGEMKWIDDDFLEGVPKVLVISFSAAKSVPAGIPIILGSSPPTDGRPYALVKRKTDRTATLHGEVGLPPTAGQCQVVASIVSSQLKPSGTETESKIKPLFLTSVELSGDK